MGLPCDLTLPRSLARSAAEIKMTLANSLMYHLPAAESGVKGNPLRSPEKLPMGGWVAGQEGGRVAGRVPRVLGEMSQEESRACAAPRWKNRL